MNTVLNVGKYLYALPFAIFGIFHFMGAEGMAPMAFGSTFLVYLTGLALVAATASMLIGKWDKLASLLLAVFLLLTAFLVHAPNISEADPAPMANLLKDLSLAGAALLYAKNEAKDKSVVG